MPQISEDLQDLSPVFGLFKPVLQESGIVYLILLDDRLKKLMLSREIPEVSRFCIMDSVIQHQELQSQPRWTSCLI